MDENITDKNRIQKQTAARKHNMFTLVRNGESVLTPPGRSRLVELKEQFMTEPGRVEYRRDLAAFIALIVELGMSNLKDTVDKGESIWTSSPIKMVGVYMNALIRLLDSWPKDTRRVELGEVITRAVSEYEQSTK